MAVTPADLTAPVGKIDSAFFPGEAAPELDARLQTYITEGEVRAADLEDDVETFDAAVTLWAYYRAFEAVHFRLIATPSLVGIVGEANMQYTGPQITAFATRAEEFKSQFDAMLDVSTTVAPPIPSGSVRTGFQF